MKKWYTAQELAGQQLPGLPTLPANIRRKLITEADETQVRDMVSSGRGRQPKEFHLACLPVQARAHLEEAAGELSPAIIPDKASSTTALATYAEKINVGNLSKPKKDKIEAKLTIIHEVSRFQRGGYDRKAAIGIYVKHHNSGLFADDKLEIVRRIGRKGKISHETVVVIMRAYEQKGVHGLIPRGRSDVAARADRSWVPYFEKYYNKPKGRSVMESWKLMQTAIMHDGYKYPSYQSVRSWNKKRPRAERERGRKTGAALAATKAFKRRIRPDFPCDVYQCDGYSFPAYIKHPEHGRNILPEVCIVIDWATGVVVSFSIGLAESGNTVGEALIGSFSVTSKKRYGGVPAILYTDGGSGNISQRITRDNTGLLSRAGVGEFKKGRPGNPQGRGLVERVNHVLHSAARELWTYRPSKTGSLMDRGVARKRYLAIQKNLRDNNRELGVRTCTLDTVPTLNAAVEVISRKLYEYNMYPHRGLPKYFCAEEGKEKNLSPYQAWDMAVANGWKIPLVDQAVIDMFEYPQYERTCNRCEVRIDNNVYFSPYLDPYNGQRVIIERNIHDAKEIKVRALDGSYICNAGFERNSVRCFAESEFESGRRKRAGGIIALKQQAIDDQRNEMQLLNDRMRLSSSTIAIPSEPLQVSCDRQEVLPDVTVQVELEVETLPVVNAVIAPLSDEEWHDSLVGIVESGGVLSDDDREQLEEYYSSDAGMVYLDFGGRSLLDG